MIIHAVLWDNPHKTLCENSLQSLYDDVTYLIAEEDKLIKNTEEYDINCGICNLLILEKGYYIESRDLIWLAYHPANLW